MKNNKGIILSTYVYILLIFFLFILGTMLVVLNNTKLLSNKLKNDALESTGNTKENFSIILLGDSEINLVVGDEFVDPGYIAQTNSGKNLVATINSNLNTTQVGNYIVRYKVKYNGKEKEIFRNITVVPSSLTETYPYDE